MSSYCTLQQARAQLDTDTTGDEAQDQDPTLFDYVLDAAQAIDNFTGRWFSPQYRELGFNGETGTYNPLLLLNDYDLVQLDTLLNGDGSTIAAANYTLLPYGRYPKSQIRLNMGYYWLAPQSTTDGVCYVEVPPYAYAEDAIRLTGIWVYHRNYLQAWKLTDLTLSANITATVESITLTGTIGTQLDAGSIIKIDNEVLLITGDLDDSTPTGWTGQVIEVSRDYDNFTATSRAAAHNSSTPVYVWQPERIITRAAAQVAAAFYKQRDNATGDQMVVQGFGAASMIIPQEMPSRAKNLLKPYWSHWRGQQ